MPRPDSFTLRKRVPLPIVQEAGWAPGSVWTGVENFSPNGIRSPDTVQPAASPYIDYANQAHTGYLCTEMHSMKLLVKLLLSFVSRDSTDTGFEQN